MVKLKVGTKVRIKKDLKCENRYGIGKINHEMLKYNGIQTEIEAVSSLGYTLKDIDHWIYQHEMLDIIKEPTTMEKKSFAIPEGCKSVTVSEESGRLVIEFEEAKKFEPKKGDILAWSTDVESGIIIFKEFSKDGEAIYFASVNTSGKKLYLNDFIGRSRPVRWVIASNDQKADVFSALEKEGLKWNAEAMRVERMRWKPKNGEYYYCISTVHSIMNDSSKHDEARFGIGDCFKTADDRLAAIELIKQTLLSYHDKL